MIALIWTVFGRILRNSMHWWHYQQSLNFVLIIGPRKSVACIMPHIYCCWSNIWFTMTSNLQFWEVCGCLRNIIFSGRIKQELVFSFQKNGKCLTQISVISGVFSVTFCKVVRQDIVRDNTVSVNFFSPFFTITFKSHVFFSFKPKLFNRLMST